ncbi:ADP-ribose pyrophosphatase [Pirellulimonas nuda]|uniref:GDP-mannose pyrophosphatase n=1 Tax=Pirellulimonas nuda TaxID=2528009 RepID=A0A518DIS1_9BACT|nr:NUDIX hydrolase [Pirellulimonas nuda]QDU91375.1 ADP-ribose pyrophosphatase [Pirellulimonas nuda]
MSQPPTTLLQAKRFRVVEHQAPLAGGGTTPYQVVEHPGAVVVLPVFEDGRVCLIRNHRIAVGRTLIEAPAGTLEPGEPPIETAARELIEETGYRAGRLEEAPPFFMSPGILSERMYCFFAYDLTEGQHAREASEQIENLIVPFPEALAMAERGEIDDAKTLVVLLRLALSRRNHG